MVSFPVGAVAVRVAVSVNELTGVGKLACHETVATAPTLDIFGQVSVAVAPPPVVVIVSDAFPVTPQATDPRPPTTLAWPLTVARLTLPSTETVPNPLAWS